MKKLILCLFLMCPFLATAEFRADIKSNEIKVMPERFYLFLNHVTSDWDRHRLTEPVILSMIDYSKSRGIPVIATVHTDAFLNQNQEASFYFVSNKNVDYIMHSDGGHHRLKFPQAEALIVGGGNFRVCLCETIRDIVSGFLPVKKEKQIFLVEEALYEHAMGRLPENEMELSQYVDEFMYPNFPCELQVSTGFGPIDTSNVNIKVFFHGKLIRELSPNRNDLPTISVRYEKWNVVKNRIDQMAGVQ